jgi:hypothetical protein
MSDENIQENKRRAASRRPNPLLFRFVCFFAIAYYGLILISMATALLFSDFLAGMGIIYVPELDLSRLNIAMYLLAGLMLNAGVITGVWMMLRRKRAGISVFMTNALLVMLFQFIPSGTGGWQKYVAELLIMLVLLLLYLHRKSVKKPETQD